MIQILTQISNHLAQMVQRLAGIQDALEALVVAEEEERDCLERAHEYEKYVHSPQVKDGG
jgi:hypothetical protein